MKTVKVLGSGCKKCQKTAEVIQNIADEKTIEISVIKETDPQQMLRYGVMKTPAVVVDDELVHSGSIPPRESIEKWLSA
jgi:small redox-active disulfide protein 2